MKFQVQSLGVMLRSWELGLGVEGLGLLTTDCFFSALQLIFEALLNTTP